MSPAASWNHDVSVCVLIVAKMCQTRTPYIPGGRRNSKCDFVCSESYFGERKTAHATNATADGDLWHAVNHYLTLRLVQEAAIPCLHHMISFDQGLYDSLMIWFDPRHLIVWAFFLTAHSPEFRWRDKFVLNCSSLKFFSSKFVDIHTLVSRSAHIVKINVSLCTVYIYIIYIIYLNICFLSF